ncbi:50S ribosomal protein L29 [Candidatus Nomurabacteria bacterium]|nr:50S ribosomal protein L29 [Candidatus Nomurabacteria bacterium]
MAKKNKTENFKEMSKEELQKKLVLLREEERVIRFKTEGSKGKNVKELANLRKQIAKVLTEVNAKSIK